jgi:hypothetical protein
MQVGDLIRDRRWTEDGYAVIVSIGDRRTKLPYEVWCVGLERMERFSKDYIEKQCEVIR